MSLTFMKFELEKTFDTFIFLIREECYILLSCGLLVPNFEPILANTTLNYGNLLKKH